MTRPLLSPGAADALLFDLGRVVLDIDFNKTLSCWAAHAGCEAAHLLTRFTRDEAYLRHERGYAMTRAGCERMVADMVAFFTGIREPRFTFVATQTSRPFA